MSNAARSSALRASYAFSGSADEFSLLNTSAALLGWNIVVVLALSAAAGYASWHLLETHAIALGGRISAQLQGRHPVRRAIDVPR